MSLPLVSVIIPAYNAQPFIAETVHSALAQTHTPLEVIVMDDGSTDDTGRIVQSFQDTRISYHYKPNTGVADTRNQGFTLSSGQYIVFLDSDDIMLPDNLSLKVSALQAHQEWGAVYSAKIVFDHVTNEDHKVQRGKGGHLLQSLLKFENGIFTAPSAYMFRRESIQKLNGYDPNMNTSADLELLVRLAQVSEIGYLDQPLVKYRTHMGQMSRSTTRMQKDMLYYFDKLERSGTIHPTDLREARARLFTILAINYIKVDKLVTKGCRCLIKAFILSPRAVLGYAPWNRKR